MTFDRLHPNINFANALTIATRGDAFFAKHWPPTVNASRLDDDLRTVHDKVSAVRASSLLRPERKQYLEQFLPEWDAWDGRPQTASDYLKAQGNWDR